MKIEDDWIPWQLGADKVGNPRQHIEIMLALVGTILVEWLIVGSNVYVRRIADD